MRILALAAARPNSMKVAPLLKALPAANRPDLEGGTRHAAVPERWDGRAAEQIVSILLGGRQ